MIFFEMQASDTPFAPKGAPNATLVWPTPQLYGTLPPRHPTVTATGAPTPMPSLTLSGLTLPCASPPYTAGHKVLSPHEASILAREWHAALRKNFAERIAVLVREHNVSDATLLPASILDDLAGEFLAYSEAFRLGGAPPDPIERIARKLAREAVLTRLRQEGREAPDESWLSSRVAWAIDKNSWFREEARRRLDSAREAASMALAEVEL